MPLSSQGHSYLKRTLRNEVFTLDTVLREKIRKEGQTLEGSYTTVPAHPPFT